MKKLKWVSWAILMLTLAWNINAYRLGVEGRASVAKWTYEASPDGRYTLAFGAGPGDWVWVQLRHKGESEVLADRWFENDKPNWVSWHNDHVRYRTGDEGGVIYLPPIWLEKWSAKLP